MIKSKAELLKSLVKPNFSHNKEIQILNTLKYGDLFAGLCPSYAPTLNTGLLSSIQLGVFSLLGGYDKDIYAKYKLKGNGLKVLMFFYSCQGSDGFASRVLVRRFVCGLQLMGLKSFELSEIMLFNGGFVEKTKKGVKVFYKLTPKGVQVAEYYQQRINVIIHNLSFMLQNDKDIKSLF